MSNGRDIRAELIRATHRACDAYSKCAPGLDVEHIFCTTPIPAVEEHGLHGLCSFMGKRFTGVDEVKRYFELVHQTMFVEQLQLPPLVTTSAKLGPDVRTDIPPAVADQWFIDTEKAAVIAVATVSLATIDRRHHWTGKLSFHLRFVEEQRREVEEREWRVEQMEIWNDATAYCITQHNQPENLLKRMTPGSNTMSLTEEDLDVFDLGGP